MKIELAKELIARFHDEAAAQAAHQEFINRFQKGAMPDEIDEKSLTTIEGTIGIANLLKDVGLAASTSEAMRMIKQGAVKIDGEKVSDNKLQCQAGTTAIYQIGKRKFAKVTLS